MELKVGMNFENTNYIYTIIGLTRKDDTIEVLCSRISQEIGCDKEERISFESEEEFLNSMNQASYNYIGNEKEINKMSGEFIKEIKIQGYTLRVDQEYNSKVGRIRITEIYRNKGHVTIAFKYIDGSGGGRYPMEKFTDDILLQIERNKEIDITIRLKGKSFKEIDEITGILYGNYFIDGEQYQKILDNYFETLDDVQLIDIFKSKVKSGELMATKIVDYIERNIPNDIFLLLDYEVDEILDAIYENYERCDYDRISKLIKEAK